MSDEPDAPPSIGGAVHFERLPARDACFLAFERPDLHMHVGATALFEAGSLRGTDGLLDIDRIRRYMESRLHLIPRCRMRVQRVPFLRAPGWVDDDAFDIRHHTHLVRVAEPGGTAELQALTGELIARQLDRTRPLWEVWFVDGLADGRVAAVVKFHHCMADGLAGIEFTKRFLTGEPQTDFDPAPSWQPRPTPAGATLLRRELTRWLTMPVRLGRAVRDIVRESGARDLFLAKVRATIATIWLGLQPTSRTPIHRRVGVQRRFSWTQIEMKEIRALRQHYGGSLNDVSLGIIAGAMSRIFAARFPRRRPPRLRAMAPTSALSREELHSSLGNRVYAPLVNLHLRTSGRAERLARIQETTRALAASRQGLGWDVMSDLAEWTGVRTQQLFMWLSMKLRSYNVVLTLVPGPHYPLYLLDAKLTEVYPILPLLDHQTVTVGVIRYTGTLYWGIVSSPEYADAFPPFVPQIDASLVDLLSEIPGAPTAAAATDAAPPSGASAEPSPGAAAEPSP